MKRIKIKFNPVGRKLAGKHVTIIKDVHEFGMQYDCREYTVFELSEADLTMLRLKHSDLFNHILILD